MLRRFGRAASQAHLLRVSVNSEIGALLDERGDEWSDTRLIARFCRRLDHSSDRVRLRDKDSVACGHFGDLGARTLIHPALKLRAYYVILGGQDGVAGLGAPCSGGDRGAQSFLGE